MVTAESDYLAYPTGYYSLSMNSSGLGGSGFRPLRFLISVTIFRSRDFGTGDQDLKWVFQMALPAVAPRIVSERSKVSEAGTSPSTIERMPFWVTFNILPRFEDITPATAPICSDGHFTSIPRIGSSRIGFAVSAAPSIARRVAGISCAYVR